MGLDGCATRSVNAERVSDIAARLLDRGEASELANVFKLLGDPNRTRLLYALLEAGEMCVCDLAEAVDVAETTVSQGLRLLRTAGIVRNRRAGRQIYYSLADSHVRMLLDLSLAHLRHDTDPEPRTKRSKKK